jgi:hypothetical protein
VLGHIGYYPRAGCRSACGPPMKSILPWPMRGWCTRRDRVCSAPSEAPCAAPRRSCTRRCGGSKRAGQPSASGCPRPTHAPGRPGIR